MATEYSSIHKVVPMRDSGLTIMLKERVGSIIKMVICILANTKITNLTVSGPAFTMKLKSNSQEFIVTTNQTAQVGKNGQTELFTKAIIRTARSTVSESLCGQMEVYILEILSMI